MTTVPLTGNAPTDRALAGEPLALLIGMVLNQQVPLALAFRASLELKDRLGGRFEAAALAAVDGAEVAAALAEPPPLHRAPGPMAERVQALCCHVVDHHGGDAAQVWATAETGDELLASLASLPGFGEAKARVFMAVLAEHAGVRPPGWEEVTREFLEGKGFSVAPAPRRWVDDRDAGPPAE
ncbi:MAG: HhH-GPD-type base excision DNA repair protein [Acidimicrobiales bacterium]